MGRMRLLSIGVAAAVLAGSISGCAGLFSKSPHMNVSPGQPAAEGTTSFSKERNGNTKIVLSVKHLADPSKLTPPASHYVAWIQRDKSAPPQNIGALKVDKNLAGKLETETALRSFDLFVTAEGAPDAMKPTGQQQLWLTHSGD
jgi:hypothetical protein